MLWNVTGAFRDEHLPQSRPLLIDLSAANIKEFAADVESSNNCAILDKNASTCQSAFDIQLPDVAVVNSFKLPAVGTEEVTNLPRNAFTDVGNEVVTISLEGANYVKVVTLAYRYTSFSVFHF